MPVVTGSIETTRNALTMATYDSGVNPFMLYVKPVLMDALILNKHTKTINDAWIIKFEIVKNANW